MSAAILSMLPKKRGRRAQAEPNPRDVLRFFPDGYKGRQFIYALAFNGGVLKVGQTSSPRRRLGQHWDKANGEVLWLHLFESMHAETARAVELRAAAALSQIAEQINGSEWFYASASKAEVIAVIRPIVTQAKAETWARWAAEEERKTRAELVYRAVEAYGIADLLQVKKRP